MSLRHAFYSLLGRLTGRTYVLMSWYYSPVGAVFRVHDIMGVPFVEFEGRGIHYHRLLPGGEIRTDATMSWQPYVGTVQENGRPLSAERPRVMIELAA